MNKKEIYLKDPFNIKDFEKFAKTTEGMSIVRFLESCKFQGKGFQKLVDEALKKKIDELDKH